MSYSPSPFATLKIKAFFIWLKHRNRGGPGLALNSQVNIMYGATHVWILILLEKFTISI